MHMDLAGNSQMARGHKWEMWSTSLGRAGVGGGGGRENDWGPRWVKSVDKEWLVPLGAP